MDKRLFSGSKNVFIVALFKVFKDTTVRRIFPPIRFMRVRLSWQCGCLTGDFRFHGGHAITKQDGFILRRRCHHR
ncbi:hypothetical protein [Holospora undulata]|uniref:hypothetical protein n=1 Tax=Holospora undulata TaxID=1169117 RepID=UPI00190F818B|nr:hypothetical protein [Holospora undulata]